MELLKIGHLLKLPVMILLGPRVVAFFVKDCNNSTGPTSE